MTTERVAMFCLMGDLHIGAEYAAIAVAIAPPPTLCDPMSRGDTIMQMLLLCLANMC
jgi:hypothetical protein